jgi:hypothetical protein
MNVNAPARTFVAKPATEGSFPLSIGLMGWPGAGKTYSALTMADGMRTPDTTDPIVIDTEGGRAAKYGRLFKFKRVEFEPPYRPTHILAAVQQQLAHKPCAIIVDSMSDEHEGEGGVLEWHEAELERMCGGDWEKRDRVGQTAWIRPKSDRRSMINGFLRIKTPLIFCFRAREKTRPMKNAQGKMVPTNIGFQPIAPLEIVGQLDLVCFLPPNSQGVPQWKTDSTAADFIIKLPIQFKQLFASPGPLTREHGRALAEWARNGTSDPPRGQESKPQTDAGPPDHHPREGGPADAQFGESPTDGLTDELMRYDRMLTEAAEQGTKVLLETAKTVPKKYRKTLTAAWKNRHWPRAAEVDGAEVG